MNMRGLVCLAVSSNMIYSYNSPPMTDFGLSEFNEPRASNKADMASGLLKKIMLWPKAWT